MNHAYWRRPDGRAHREDNEKYAPSSLLAAFGKNATVRGQQISWTWQGHRENEIAIGSSVIILDPDGRELNEDDSVGIVHNSLNEVIRGMGGGKPVLPKRLLSCINKNTAEFFRTPKTKRTLVTSLSIDDLPSEFIEIEEFRITRCSRRTHPYPDAVLENQSFVSTHVEGTRYCCVAVETNVGTISQAFDTAISAINLLRGVWNLLATYKSANWSLSIFPQRTWIGKVHTGPIHTLHKHDGSLETELYWLEPDYLEDAALFKPRDGWERVEAGRNNLCKLIAKSPFKQDLIVLLTRYATALDQGNLDVSFLMLWSLLERITDTVGANYDLTIERAISMYSDRSSCKQLLNQMRNRRNQFVHSARSTTDRDQFCYTLKSFVDGHLVELIYNNFNVNSIAEYGQFLSLPHNADRLRRLREWYSLAFAIRTRQFEGEGVAGEGI